MTRQRVLITGVTGLVGRTLAARLAMDGVEVVAVSRSPRNSSTVHGVQQSIGWDESFPECQAVVHLAGESIFGIWTTAKRRSILKSRVEMTRKVVAAMSRMKIAPQVFVCASAVGIYGDRPGEILNETSSLGKEGFLTEVCQRWEAEAIRAEAHGIRTVRARLGLVMDRSGGMLGTQWPALRLGIAGILGSGKNDLPWISLRDVAGLIQFAIQEKRVSGAMNLTAPHSVTQNEWIEGLNESMPFWFRAHLPESMVKWSGEDFSKLVLGSLRVRPEKALECGYLFCHPEWRGYVRTIG